MAKTIMDYIKSINKDNVNQRKWTLDTERWVTEFSKGELLKFLPEFISQIKKFGIESHDHEVLLNEVKNGKYESIKKSLTAEEE